MRTHFSDLSNEQLLSNLRALVGQGHVHLARLLAYLGEVEERRLDLESACSSLYEFCVRRLGLGEDEAYRRVHAARIARRFPIALNMVERGEIHLTGLLLLRDHLTQDNHEELLRAASGKTKAQVKELLAARSPRPDVPSLITVLPAVNAPGEAQAPIVAPSSERSSKPARIEPLAPARYGVQFTASAELKEKIERATNMMRHANPKGDLSVVMERAFDLLIAELEKKKLGKTKRPRIPRAPRDRKKTRPGYVTTDVRREVFERDGEQCTFIDKAGRRCEARALLELDHQQARARGGGDEADNVIVRCRAHNGLRAEHDFGRAHIEKKKNEKRKESESRDERPLQRGDELATALRALTGLGFEPPDARRALEIISERWDSSPPPIETILREALAVLT